MSIIDVDLGQLSPSLLSATAKRLADLRAAMRAPGAVMFAQSPLIAELERLGVYGVEALDHVVADPLLNVAAAVHICAGRALLRHEVRAKRFPLGFLHGTAADDDPLSLAVLTGITLALDSNRAPPRTARRRPNSNLPNRAA